MKGTLFSALLVFLPQISRMLLSSSSLDVYQYRHYAGLGEYFNTGTWTDLTSLDIASLGKITKLIYVVFEYPDESERPRGRLKEWHGYHRIEEDVAIA